MLLLKKTVVLKHYRLNVRFRWDSSTHEMGTKLSCVAMQKEELAFSGTTYNNNSNRSKIVHIN